MLLDVIVCPRDALRTLGKNAPVGAVLVVLGVLQAIVGGAQGWILQPVVLADPLLVESPEGMAPMLARYWLARGVAIVLTPAAIFLRAAALATLLQSGAALFGVGLRWRVLLSLALHLEVIFWLENLCVTLLLAVRRPAGVDELAGLRLHAGLDLLWRPHSSWFRALFESANLFTMWWAVLLGAALVTWMCGRRRLAVTTAGGFWLALVFLRIATSPG